MKLVYLLSAIFILCLVGFVTSASIDDGRYQANKPVTLNFRCSVGGEIPSVAAVYHFQIMYPNGSLFIPDTIATPEGQGMFSYDTTFKEIGIYKVYQFCTDPPLYPEGFSNTDTIEITSTGDNSNITLTLVIVLLVFAVILFLGAIVLENEILGFISGLLFSVAGVFVMIYGFGNLANIYTQSIAYVSLGWGIILVAVAGWKMLSEITE